MTEDKANNSEGRGDEVGLPAGTKIGKYEVRERLGIGGQAIVYRCYDPTLERDVAIKQISSHLSEDEEFVSRFRREAQVLARVGAMQPAVITIHELLEDERGLFIVMEYVRGETLETVIRNYDGPAETRAVLQLIWRLAAALHDVHKAGIIHRDLKPGNIIVSEGLRPKISDFGLAAAGAEQTSVLMGTTKYMAPELFEGKPADARVDMYSLGFIAYEMLLGREKFNEVFADVVRDRHTAAMRWMKWHGNKQVQAPALHELNPSVPKALSGIVAKMIAKDPDERFQTMEELGRAIKQHFSPRFRAAGAGAGIAAGGEGQGPPAEGRSEKSIAPEEGDELELELEEPPPTAPIPSGRFSTRLKIGLAAFIGLVIVVGGVAIGVRMGRERADIAGEYSRAADLYEEGKLEHDRDKLAEAAERFEHIRVEHGGTEAAARASVRVHMARAHVAVLDQDWDAAAKEEASSKDHLRTVQREELAPVSWVREIDDEIDGFEAYRLNARTFASAERQARDRMAAGRFDEAETGFQRELEGLTLTDWLRERRDEFLHELRRQRVVTTFEDAVERGDDLAEQQEYEQAAESYAEAEQALESEYAEEVLSSDELTSMRNELSEKTEELDEDRRYAEAIEAADQAADNQAKIRHLETAAEIRPSDELQQRIDRLQADIHYEQAQRMRDRGDFSGAMRALEQSLEYADREDVRREMENLSGRIEKLELTQAGDEAADAGNLEQALSKYRQAAELEQTQQLREKINLAEFQLQFAEAERLREEGEFDEAVEAYERARQIRPQAEPQVEARLSEMMQRRQYDELIAQGDEHLQEDRWHRAMNKFKEAQEVMDTEEVARRQDRANHMRYKAEGNDAMERGNYSEALGYFRIAERFESTQEIENLIAEARARAESQ